MANLWLHAMTGGLHNKPSDFLSRQVAKRVDSRVRDGTKANQSQTFAHVELIVEDTVPDIFFCISESMCFIWVRCVTILWSL